MHSLLVGELLLGGAPRIIVFGRCEGLLVADVGEQLGGLGRVAHLIGGLRGGLRLAVVLRGELLPGGGHQAGDLLGTGLLLELLVSGAAFLFVLDLGQGGLAHLLLVLGLPLRLGVGPGAVSLRDFRLRESDLLIEVL